METFVLAALAVALIVAVLSLVRESRLRRALQRLLTTLLKHRRQNETDRNK